MARWLNAEGYQHRGKRWCKYSVTSVLRSEAVIGRIVFNRDGDNVIRVDSHEPIIDIGTWSVVQDLMDAGINPAKTGSPRSGHLFTGLCVCGSCGSKLQARSSKGGKYFYYECRKKERYGTCDQKAIVGEINQENSNKSSNIKLLESRIEEVQVDIDRMVDIVQKQSGEGIEPIIDRIKFLTLEKKHLEDQVKEFDSYEELFLDDAIHELCKYLVDCLKSLSDPHRYRLFFSSFVDKVLVEEVLIKVYYRPENIINTVIKNTVLGKVDENFKWLPDVTIPSTKNNNRTMVIPL